jgi:hypothetical protein
MKWPHICGRSTGWKGVVFRVLHWWRLRTGYYPRHHAAMQKIYLDEAVRKLADEIDRRAFEAIYGRRSSTD